GKLVYDKYCVGCHGVKGDGKGAAAVNLLIKPRDLTQGLFKFKSTLAGSLPTDDDLKNSITNGLSPSSMPSFKFVPEDEKDDLVAYIKTLSPKWNIKTATKEFLKPTIPDLVGTKASIATG
ncbi:MAG: cytochrome c, partial [Nitrospirae bacterium]|nr:cytochrome c [Nitrospirota bacterium]